jgi:hypothetical protein
LFAQIEIHAECLLERLVTVHARISAQKKLSVKYESQGGQDSTFYPRAIGRVGCASVQRRFRQCPSGFRRRDRASMSRRPRRRNSSGKAHSCFRRQIFPFVLTSIFATFRSLESSVCGKLMKRAATVKGEVRLF